MNYYPLRPFFKTMKPLICKLHIPSMKKAKTMKIKTIFPAGTGRKLNVHKTSRTSSERLMYVQLMSCVYGVNVLNKILSDRRLLHMKISVEIWLRNPLTSIKHNNFSPSSYQSHFYHLKVHKISFPMVSNLACVI